jgi:hypothetical protein
MADPVQPKAPGRNNTLLMLVSWLWVGVPLAWGILETLRTSMALLR